MSQGHGVNNNNNFLKMKQSAEGIFKRNARSIAPVILPGVEVESLIEVKCEQCHSEAFYPVYTLKFASRFQTTNSVPAMVQVPLGFACAECGKINPWKIEDLIGGGAIPTDQDGQKQKQNKEEKEPGSTLGISVSDGTKTSEKVG